MKHDPIKPLFGMSALELFSQDKLILSRGSQQRLPDFMYKGMLESIDSLCKDYSGGLEIAGGTAEGGIQTPVSGVHPTALLKLGLTVYFRDIGNHIPELRGWLRQLEASLGVPECAAAMAFANAASSGLSLHHDRYDHLFFQVSGTKRFRYALNTYVKNPDVQYSPIAPSTFQFGQSYQNGFPESSDAILLKPMETLELRPGDVFFMPAGTWHTTSDQPTDSLSIVVAVRAPSYLDIFERYLRYYVGQAPEWRSRVYGGWSDDAGRSQTVHEKFEHLVADLGPRMDKFRVSDAFKTWIAHTPLVDIKAKHDIDSRFDRYIRSPGASLSIQKGSEVGELQCVVRSGPTNRLQARYVIAIQEEARPIVEWIMKLSAAFSVENICENFLDFHRDDITHLLASLAHAGLLRPIPVPEWKTLIDSRI